MKENERPSIGAQEGPQQEFLATKANICIFGGAAGGGKALWIETPIPTIDGWKKMGELQIGDIIFSDDGKSCKVIATYPVILGNPCYKVIFSDNSEIIADAEHLWKTMSLKDRTRLARLTDEFREKRKLIRKSKSKGLKP